MTSTAAAATQSSTTLPRHWRAALQLLHNDSWRHWPWLAQFLTAWGMIFVMIGQYVGTVWRLRRRLTKLRQQPEQWCRVIPLVSVPQTKAAKAVTARRALGRLLELLRRETDATSSHTEETTTMTTSIKETTTTTESEFSDQHILKVLRSSFDARLAATQFMIPARGRSQQDHYDEDDDSDSASSELLQQQLQRLWPQLLEIPIENDDAETLDYDISVIVPAYRETNAALNATLRTAYKMTTTNENGKENLNLSDKKKLRIQVIVVDASPPPTTQTTTMTSTTSATSTSNQPPPKDNDKNDDPRRQYHLTHDQIFQGQDWADTELVPYHGPGGRGGAMNFGAQKVNRRCKIFTFLHSDTRLPPQWHRLVHNALVVKNNNDKNDKNKNQNIMLCAFGMGIDMTNLDPIPPGLRAADWQGRIRSNYCHFPYGDSALSLHRAAFDYIGGFPHNQPLLEDYEMASLFRLRAGILEHQPLHILPANIACSPRRWQTLNVAYVHLINWMILQRYEGGATAEEIFQLYYQQPAPNNQKEHQANIDDKNKGVREKNKHD